MSDVQFYIKKFCRRLLEVILLVPAFSLNYLWWDIHEHPQSYQLAFVEPVRAYRILAIKRLSEAQTIGFNPSLNIKFRIQLVLKLRKIMY